MSNEIDFLLNKMKLIETKANKPNDMVVEEKSIHPLIAATKDLIHEGTLVSVKNELLNEYEENAKVIVETSQSFSSKLKKVVEASPDTLLGSFTNDLNDSKKWLSEVLKKGLKGRNPGTIYVLGSWYGNMGLYLDGFDIEFDKLVLVETDEEKLLTSGIVLDKIRDQGKLVLIHQSADDMVYESPGLIINTSCNETGPGFLKKVPEGMLCVLQGRNSVSDVMTQTNSLQEFVDQFPMSKTYYKAAKTFYDPETAYERFMIIGRAGESIEQKINEVAMTPTLFKKAIDIGQDSGVKIGFEFEFCVPAKALRRDTSDLAIVKEVFKNERSFPGLRTSDKNRFSFGEVKPETMDMLFIPNNKEYLSKTYKTFKDVFDDDPEGFRDTSYPYLLKRIYPNVYAGVIERNITDFFNIPNPKKVLELLGKANGGVVFDEEYLQATNIDSDIRYKLAASVVKEITEETYGEQAIVFDEYHQRKKNTTSWYIEPDSSISPEDKDAGVELVSPPLEAKKAMEDLDKFFTMAEKYDFYTGKDHDTGIHINISIPEKLDVLKLAVFLGDEYVLKAFGREDSDYAVSVMKSLGHKPNYNITDVYKTKKKKLVLDFRKLAKIAKDTVYDHYASISGENKKYLSFRHAGGDYIRDKDKIKETVGRFVRAMLIATDPNAYTKEYKKKLIKLFGTPKELEKDDAAQDSYKQIRETINYIKTNGLPVLKVTAVATDNHFNYYGSGIHRTLSNLKILDHIDYSFLRNLGRRDFSKSGPAFDILNSVLDIPDYAWTDVGRYMHSDKSKLNGYTVDLLPFADAKSIMAVANYQPDLSYNTSGKIITITQKSFLPYNDSRVQKIVKDLLSKVLSKSEPIHEEILDEAGQPEVYYFAYGMLTDPKIMRGKKLIGIAELRNFEYNMYLYANVQPKPGSKVYGTLWEVDRDYIKYLDKIEGFPTLYDRRTYAAYVDGVKYPAEVYVMTPNTLKYVQGTFPKEEYIESIENGYTNAGIPLEQLDNALEKAWEKYIAISKPVAPDDYY